tara:strand:- start:393 stop:845 length:453 start_codon:yes stop_codon:yes gene_type:complete
MKECSICLDIKEKFDYCFECKHETCMDCSKKVDICPYCRDDHYGYLIDTEQSDWYSLGVGKLPVVKNKYKIFGVDFDIRFTKKSVIMKSEANNFRFARTHKYGYREVGELTIEFQMKKQELVIFKDEEYVVVNAQTLRFFHSTDKCSCGC